MKRFKDILCVVDPGKQCKLALERSVTLAENNQANLTVIAVVPAITAGIGMPEGGPISTDLQLAAVKTCEEGLEALVKTHRRRIEIATKVLTGIPFLMTIREVLRNGHDLVVKCPESQDWLERLFSSEDMHLLRKCPCPVWMVKPQVGVSFDRILAAVDVDQSYPPEELKTRQTLNETTLQLAGSLAVSEFAELHVAHTWQVMWEGALRGSAVVKIAEQEVETHIEKVRQNRAQLLDALMKSASVKLGQDAIDFIKPQLHMPKGAARKEIPELARKLQADCVVMGTVGRTGIAGFFIGNTAENILDQLDCSVLAIKPPGFVTPVTLEE